PQAEMDRAAAGPLSGALAAPKLQDASGKIDPVTGKISLQIGTGDHAQRAIVYQTIQWSFIAGGLITGCVFLFLAFKGDQASVPISVK
ncbi:hypothetical protein, partial [Chryseobacterium sp. SIMBA_028]|uniref:hypothetical protein n=1 Tax=Chryseobacterium sp. SIMBA_028 TaxID=3085771 RepID=UPI00397B969E